MSGRGHQRSHGYSRHWAESQRQANRLGPDNTVWCLLVETKGLCWLLGTSVLKIGILSTTEQASLLKHVRSQYNQRGPCCSYSLATCLSSRRDAISALCIHLSQATSMFQLSRDPSTFFALDQTTNDLIFARNIRRYDPRKSRTACGERPVTTPTGHPSSPNQTTGLSEKGSASPGASGQDSPNLETGALPCPGRRRCSAFIVSSSVCSGSAHRRRIPESLGFRPRQSL